MRPRFELFETEAGNIDRIAELLNDHADMGFELHHSYGYNIGNVAMQVFVMYRD